LAFWWNFDFFTWFKCIERLQFIYPGIVQAID